MSLDLSFLSMKENSRMSTMLEPSPANTCVEDEWTNVSTIVPYTTVWDSAPVLQEKQKQGPTVDKRRSKDPLSTSSLPAPARKEDAKQNSWISKLVRTVDKLARKYAIPVEKRRSKAYKRKVKTSPIIPKVFSSLYTPEVIPVVVMS